MLQITVPESELWDEELQEFVYVKETRLSLEHSLISLSKWEEKYRRPYLSASKTPEEFIDYVRFMTINKNIDPDIFRCLTVSNISDIKKYIDDTPTATWFSEKARSGSDSEVTAEIIYYWMISYGIGKEFEKWNLNKLLILIRVFSEKNKPQKKMTRSEILQQNAELNAKRKQKLNTKG